jgi:hypothetical protein
MALVAVMIFQLSDMEMGNSNRISMRLAMDFLNIQKIVDRLLFVARLLLRVGDSVRTVSLFLMRLMT